MKSGVITAARLIEENCIATKSRHHAVMVTLTYRPEVSWESYHITRYIDAVKKWALRKGFPLQYVWVMELTEKGIPHYHAIFWLPHAVWMPKADKRGWWKHGHSQTAAARNAIGYCAKYASKGQGPSNFPRHARIHGCAGLTPGAKLERRWWLFPSYIREKCTPSDDVIRALGGGFVSRTSGQFWPSEWGLVASCSGAVRIVLLADWYQWHEQSAPLSCGLSLRPESSTLDKSIRGCVRASSLV